MAHPTAADGGAVGSFVGKSVALANDGEWDGTSVGAMVFTEIMVGGRDKSFSEAPSSSSHCNVERSASHSPPV